MKIGILGTGIVGNTIANKLVQRNHEVKMGSRTPKNEKAIQWVAAAGSNASHGTFKDAAEFGEVIFNCTKGDISVDALRLAGSIALTGKILIDLANPLDFSNGMPPSLFISNTDSLGEAIQREFPETSVVKTLNTMNCNLMVDSSLVKGDHDVFISGNDAAAKATVAKILSEDFGWKNILDLGDITGARSTEMLLPIWLRLYGKFGNSNFNFHITK
ncbi:NADP oxidoreductase coenzyme F420-dependent [Leptospira broomii serovar Hurstbridge str. 5399]|uniref:NADP oxidoreductase coenzyme F420-dependent n=1 Tax=Leptospira broomii serovar Hurstbridge str. 5399 TaxID=1049789 RepID=T0FAN6_9LEPT|nr:NAD(P)-binding domain-containing protein [Leptospira broomii]EQA44587.1 NADP oxidoreductase coenzyme F420-dependent [Leptospira broomii serovar Hurstbridge str. 5399]